jgi:hypothetical protein
VDELQAEEAEVSGGFLTENTSGNGGCLVGDQAGGGRRRSGDGQLDNLFCLKDMRGRDTGSAGADIQGLG